MPNSFTVFPNVLPGNVTIGGTLTVGADVIRIGAAAPYCRVGKTGGNSSFISWNQGADQATFDSGVQPSLSAQFQPGGAGFSLLESNAAGNTMREAWLRTIFSDYTAHSHTGTTTEDTIYSKVIRGGIIGANGGIFGKLYYNASAQGGVNTTVRVKLGGVLVGAFNFVVSAQFWGEFTILNANAQNAQKTVFRVNQLNSGTFAADQQTPAVDTSVDQTLTVTVQNGTSTDTQTFNMIIASLGNSFGPV